MEVGVIRAPVVTGPAAAGGDWGGVSVAPGPGDGAQLPPAPIQPPACIYQGVTSSWSLNQKSGDWWWTCLVCHILSRRPTILTRLTARIIPHPMRHMTFIDMVKLVEIVLTPYLSPFIIQSMHSIFHKININSLCTLSTSTALLVFKTVSKIWTCELSFTQTTRNIRN